MNVGIAGLDGGTVLYREGAGRLSIGHFDGNTR